GDALGELIPEPCDLANKWPNDILVGGRKVAGILVEAETGKEDGPDFIVVGIGVNLVSFPQDVEFPATSVAAEYPNSAISPASMLEAFARSFWTWAECWREQGFVPVRL